MTIRVLPVVPGVVCVQRVELLACSYVVARPDGLVLVDCGIDPAGADMEAGIRALGGRVEDVRAILLTHWHNDHSAGAPRLRARSGARVHYHAAGRDRFTRRSRSRGLRGWLARRLPDHGLLAPVQGLLDAAPPAPIEADMLVRDGDLVAGAFRVLETPGHEAGHVSYLLEPEGVLFSGDAVAVAGDHPTWVSRLLTDDLAAARRSMRRCLELAPRALCPGHRHPLVDAPPEVWRRAAAQVAGPWPIFGS